MGTLLIERLLDLLVLLVIFFAALLGASRIFPRPFLLAAGAAGAGALAVLLLLVLRPEAIGQALGRMLAWPRIPSRWRDRLVMQLGHLVESLAILRSPGRAAALLGLSLVAWIAEGGVFAAAAWSLGLSAPGLAPWLALGAATLATLLPSTPGYVGTFDWFATLGFTAYGMDRSGAAAAALLAHVVVWLPVTLAGLAVLARRPARTPALLKADPA